MNLIIEAVVLTGGASRRMGTDKALIPVDGVPMARRIVDAFQAANIKVTVLGRQAIDGAEFQLDRDEFGGPLAAIARFTPTATYVFVASCDLPCFTNEVVTLLSSKIGTADSAIPVMGGRHQPLCALYTASAFEAASKISETGERKIMAWIEHLTKVEVHEGDFRENGIDPIAVLGVNTDDELKRVMSAKKSESN